jgi:hypothetical protein
VLVTIALVVEAVVGSSGQRERLRRSRRRRDSGRSETQARGGGHHRRAPRVHRGDDLFGIDALQVDAAPRGAMRKEMKDDNISSVLAGMPASG